MGDPRLEERYVIIKIKKLSEYQAKVLRECLQENHIGTIDGLVLEADWPEYRVLVPVLFKRRWSH